MARKKTKRIIKKERIVKPKNFDELAERAKINAMNIKTMHDDMEKRLKGILSTQAKILDYIASTRRHKTKLNRIEGALEKLEKAFEHKDRISEHDVKELQNVISKEFDHINSIFVSALEKLKEKTDKTELELGILRERIKDVKTIEENMKELDIKAMRRDIEVLKTKNDWIGDRIESIDMNPLEQRILSLERKIRAMRTTLPLIIE